MLAVQEGESVGTGRTRIIRTWPTDPDQPLMPDVGDVLQTSVQGRLWLVTGCKPTRGHPPEARRLTLTVVAIDPGDDVPETADTFQLTYGRRPLDG